MLPRATRRLRDREIPRQLARREHQRHVEMLLDIVGGPLGGPVYPD
jgi:hypothetical protein